MEPGTALSVASLGIQVASGIQSYFKLWNDCEQDVSDLRNSLVRTMGTFEHLKAALREPRLNQILVSTICLNIKTCEERVEELASILKKFEKEGSPSDLLKNLKFRSRRALYPFRASTISRISEIIEDMKDDLQLALEILLMSVGINTVIQ